MQFFVAHEQNWANILVLAAAFYYLGFYHPGTIYSQASAGFNAPLFGLCFFLLVNWFVREEISLSWLAAVGLFSYSLYLTHEFVFNVIGHTLLIGFPACLVFAYLFYLVFEKPFMRSAPTVRRTELASEMG